MNDVAEALDKIEDDEATGRILMWVLDKYAPSGFRFASPMNEAAPAGEVSDEFRRIRLEMEKEQLRSMRLNNELLAAQVGKPQGA